MTATDPRQDRSGAPADSTWRAAARRSAPAVTAAVPVILVNATAFVGQYAWVQQHVPLVLPFKVLFSVTVESIAVYLAYHAHKALLANDSAGRLKFAAYAFALVIGAMNYSHWAVRWQPSALAVGFGLMSALSPWLWGIHSRRASRDALLAQGLVEPHAVRLGANRVMWHPLRATVVMSRSAWTGENDPKRAIADYDETRQVRGRATRRAVRQGGAATAPARQEVEQMPAPAAAPAQELPAAPRQESAPAIVAQAAPEVPQAAPAQVPAPAPAAQPELAKPVQAIAALSAAPRVQAHEISPQRLAEVTAYLNGLPARQLPSARWVSDILCPDHDHRRPATTLIRERKALGQDPVQPPRTLRSVTGMIASPLSTLPGGISANG